MLQLFDVDLIGSKEKARGFTIKTRKGEAHGCYSENIIRVFAIHGESSLKGIMDILTKTFKTNKVIFTPLVNDNLKNVVKGEVKILKADNPENPYGEDFEYLECDWVRT